MVHIFFLQMHVLFRRNIIHFNDSTNATKKSININIIKIKCFVVTAIIYDKIREEPLKIHLISYTLHYVNIHISQSQVPTWAVNNNKKSFETLYYNPNMVYEQQTV